MPFIKVIGPESARGRLSRIYHRVSGVGGQVDNVLQIHSLRPHSLEGHMALYKAVLHHPRNKLPTWFLEAIGVLVSLCNECSYCAKHHGAGMQRLLAAEPEKFEACMVIFYFIIIYVVRVIIHYKILTRNFFWCYILKPIIYNNTSMKFWKNINYIIKTFVL